MLTSIMVGLHGMKWIFLSEYSSQYNSVEIVNSTLLWKDSWIVKCCSSFMRLPTAQFWNSLSGVPIDGKNCPTSIAAQVTSYTGFIMVLNIYMFYYWSGFGWPSQGKRNWPPPVPCVQVNSSFIHSRCSLLFRCSNIPVIPPSNWWYFLWPWDVIMAEVNCTPYIKFPADWVDYSIDFLETVTL